MKCPKCNQEIIDNKEYCPNCGKKLRETKTGISTKTLLIIGAFLILLGGGITLSIMFLGTDKELEKYIDDEDKNNSEEETDDDKFLDYIILDNYIGNYTISNIITTDETPQEILESKNDLIGWAVEFNEKILKFGLYKIEWILIDNPDVYLVKDTSNIKTILNTTSDIEVISVEGKNSIIPDSTKKITFNFIKTKDKLYIYYMNTLFELTKSEFEYKENKNFYSLKLLEEDYTEEINNKIKVINDGIKTMIESEDISIVLADYEIIEDNNVRHILINVSNGYPNAAMYTSLSTISYNKNTLKMYNLKDYLNYINKSYDDIVLKYNEEKPKIISESVGDITKELDIKEDSLYYVKDNKLFLPCAISSWGYLFVEIKL